MKHDKKKTFFDNLTAFELPLTLLPPRIVIGIWG